MAMVCRSCGRQYDVTLFQFGRTVRCDCGLEVGEPLDLARRRHQERARSRMHALQRRADQVCQMILAADFPEVDVEIAMARFRELALEMYPGSDELYEMIYDSRFRRLWKQFRV